MERPRLGCVESLVRKSYIGDPVNKNKSVPLTEEGARKAEELFWKLFGKSR
jgi:hypothetical protein